MNQLNNITIKHCPCHSGKSYEQCCRLFHLDFYQAQTAEDLMRSRFTAFAIGSMNSENQKFFEQYLLQDLASENETGRDATGYFH
ncbi:hypothetical protein [Thiomicrorhabdus indica]|uniref:hypothetical protein n=1 Tax=Thiomicrorhabdus indica TaxID=2267253 RepID=UPI00102DDACF|nr:hypothetical protein [Thiomicrorhabdus indica]